MSRRCIGEQRYSSTPFEARDWVVTFTSPPLYPPERTPMSTEQEAGWALQAVWAFWRKISFPHPGIRNPHLSAPSLQLHLLRMHPYWRQTLDIKVPKSLSIYLSFRSCDSCRRLPEPKHHSFLFSHWSPSKCLLFMAARTPSIHVFLGRHLFLLSPGIHSIINFGSLSSCILLTWPYHRSLFLSMMSIISGFSFTPTLWY